LEAAYECAGAAWLVLLFKVMVIVPVVSGMGQYLKDEEEEPVSRQTEDTAAPPRICGSLGVEAEPTCRSRCRGTRTSSPYPTLDIDRLDRRH
jgi:hypothetical protein